MYGVLENSPWPYYSEDEICLSRAILESGNVNYWTGTYGKKLESEFSKYLQTPYTLCLANGTLALQSAYAALGLQAGDEIITSPRTFIATISAAVLTGATPVFADVDIDSGLITAETIEPLITSKTKAICVVHLGGWPADMEAIVKLASSYSIPVIEDCAQAHGASINGQKVGTFADISAWSFCQDKIISTAGEGGLIATKNKDLYESIWSFRDHGKSLKLVNKQMSNNSFRWLHETIGSNYRLTEIQSAIGSLQLKKLPDWTKVRERNAMCLYEVLKDLPILHIPLPNSNIQHGWYKFYAYIRFDYLIDGIDRDSIVKKLVSLGLPAFSGSCSEVYLEKCLKGVLSANFQRLPNAQKLGETSIMFLVHPTINQETIYKYAMGIRDVFLSASITH